MLMDYIMTNIIKKFPSKIRQNKMKTGIILGLFAYWGVVIMGTLKTFN